MTDKKSFPDFAKATPGKPEFKPKKPLTESVSVKEKAVGEFPDFPSDVPATPQGNPSPVQKLQAFLAKRFGEQSLLARLSLKLGTGAQNGSPLDQLTQIRQQHTSSEKINLALTIVLIVLLAYSWKNFPLMVTEINQKRNDILDQTEKIVIEKENNATIEKLKNDKDRIRKNRGLVDLALPPNEDEKAEDIISMIENMGYPELQGNILTIESIGIREVSDSQFYNDELLGVVQAYEYAFSAEGTYAELMGFIQRLRRSKRIMDIMTLELEEKKEGGFKASFSVFAYHLLGETPVAEEPSSPKA